MSEGLTRYEQWVELTATPHYPCYECYIEEDHDFCTRKRNSDSTGNICTCTKCWSKP